MLTSLWYLQPISRHWEQDKILSSVFVCVTRCVCGTVMSSKLGVLRKSCGNYQHYEACVSRVMADLQGDKAVLCSMRSGSNQDELLCYMPCCQQATTDALVQVCQCF
jgi:hypothetical protein